MAHSIVVVFTNVVSSGILSSRVYNGVKGFGNMAFGTSVAAPAQTLGLEGSALQQLALSLTDVLCYKVDEQLLFYLNNIFKLR